MFAKAAVLTCRLAWNHPLPDGNKRAAWAALVMFINLIEGSWNPDPPDVDDAEPAMQSVAAGEVNEEWVASCYENACGSTERSPGASAVVISRLQSMHVAIRSMMHAG